jgi:hypothetical protein
LRQTGADGTAGAPGEIGFAPLLADLNHSCY